MGSTILYKKLAICSLVSILSASVLSTMAIAQSQSSEPETRQGLPGGRVGGGTRGNCYADEPLLAFIPESGLLKTDISQSSLWVYLPQSDVIQSVEFILYDPQETIAFETTFPTPSESGLLELKLTEMAPTLSLEANQQYRWFLSLVCPYDRAADIVVDGVIQPINAPQHPGEHQDWVAHLHSSLEADQWSDALARIVEAYHHDETQIAATEQWDQLMQLMNDPPVPFSMLTELQSN